ncbi:dihydrodipicolinate reductase-like protein CRR1, chloroplastic isoform X1 [Sorghum bicolor]|uniref:dihydrodipicolinate reductase-like protein CRR1, chloroplastic isoform X1 n=1 Tax=Sorghum bicolor TaxID=4558 RepID=UPI000B4252ED|nr:dihydrodipicolinate reductase-like protein CRR1, chloroplastic isoform X1 [Sorghum bicolor]|eukprot:XP_021313049.1 dihydrodipicolinate reductase-like protein CRR1, chloroplastic isoform X1 [Sorghum bicolor]
MPSDSDPSMREHRDEEECSSGEGPLLHAANAAAAGPEHDQGCYRWGHEGDREDGRSCGDQGQGNGACRGDRLAVHWRGRRTGFPRRSFSVRMFPLYLLPFFYLIGAVNAGIVLQISGMDEPLEIPVLNDLTMVLGSIAQSRATGVVVDFSEPSAVYDNVKQAAAFGLSSVVYVPKIELDTVTELSAFCEKASMGCLVAPTLSIGSVLLQQAAIQASFHYSNVEIVESRPNPSDLPSQDAIQIANNISDLGQIYNREDMDSSSPARGQLLGEDGVRVHSMVLPGLVSSTSINFSGPGEIYALRHDVANVQCLMPGLILAIRKVVRLKNLIYGLEKFL